MKFRQQVKQITAATRDEVMVWVETTPHHVANAEDPKFMILKGHHDILRIPTNLWKRCYVKSSGYFDTRLYRWDFDKHKAHILKLRDKRRKNKPKKVAKSRFAERPQLHEPFDEDLAHSALR